MNRTANSLPARIRRLSFRDVLELTLPRVILHAYYRLTNPTIPDRSSYLPCFSPMRVDKRFLTMAGQITARSVVGYEALWVIYQMALQSTRVTGNFLEAGVYKGGTARFLKMLLDENPREDRSLLLFDTFAGMPDVDPSQDIHKKGDFDDTSLAAVTEWVGQDHVRYYPGFMPQTFAGLEDEVFAFAHIDVDLKSSVEACCAFVYPRMSPGGVIVFDDYGHRTCPGARVAVDEFFRDRPENPLALPHGQAIVFKLP